MTPQPLALYRGNQLCQPIKADPAGYTRFYITARGINGDVLAGPDDEFEALSNVFPHPKLNLSGHHLPIQPR